MNPTQPALGRYLKVKLNLH